MQSRSGRIAEISNLNKGPLLSPDHRYIHDSHTPYRNTLQCMNRCLIMIVFLHTHAVYLKWRQSGALSLLQLCRCVRSSASCSVSFANGPLGTEHQHRWICCLGDMTEIISSSLHATTSSNSSDIRQLDPGLAAASGSLLSICFFCGLPTTSETPTLVLFSVSLQSGLWYGTFSVY